MRIERLVALFIRQDGSVFACKRAKAFEAPVGTVGLYPVFVDILPVRWVKADSRDASILTVTEGNNRQ